MASSEKPNGEQVLEPEVSEILEGIIEPQVEAHAEAEAETEAEVIELDPLQTAQDQAAEYLNLAHRTRADLENYRRRTAKEREDLLRYGSEKVLIDVLGVMDNVERSQEHAADGSPLAEGFRMLHAGLVAVLEKNHVTEVDGLGTPFDPNIHNAIQTVESDAVEKGHVVEVYQKGYKLHERLLRPAMVSVAG